MQSTHGRQQEVYNLTGTISLFGRTVPPDIWIQDIWTTSGDDISAVGSRISTYEPLKWGTPPAGLEEKDKH
jgi:hypothetical protein